MPTQYQLDINIDADGVSSIVGANQAVTIVKCVTPFVMTAGVSKTTTNQVYLPVAWLEFQPFETNTVMWTESYEVYASPPVLTAPGTIQQLSSTPQQAQLGWIYTFQNNTFTGAQGGGGDAATYNLTNAQVTTFSFGLSQQAVVNGQSTTFVPLNAVPVMHNQQATFSPGKTVYIFLSTNLGNGVVISAVPDQALKVTLTPQTPVAIGFNDATNTFYLNG
jgi:hypothetical protein